MTTYKYGAWCGAQATGKVTHRAFLAYDITTNNDTTYTITAFSGIDPWNSTWSNVTVDYWRYATDKTTVSGQSVRSASTSDNITLVSSAAISYTKGHSAVTKTITAQTQLNHVVSSAGGASVNGKTSSAAVTFTIPAKTSYVVTFNAHGGAGAPGNQTKWYGENLTLSSTTPSRENYTFRGWATSEARADAGNVDYASGATYSSNAALSLWAVWEHIYIEPILSTLKVRRTATNSSSTEDIEGNYLYIYFYYVGGHFAGESILTPTCTIKLDGNTLTPAPLMSDSGTVEVWYNISSYSTSTSHTLEIKLEDTEGNLITVYTVPSTKYPIELEPDGSMMALGVPTRFKDDIYIDIDTNASPGTVDGDLYAAIVALGWENDVIV